MNQIGKGSWPVVMFSVLLTLTLVAISVTSKGMDSLEELRGGVGVGLQWMGHQLQLRRLPGSRQIWPRKRLLPPPHHIQKICGKGAKVSISNITLSFFLNGILEGQD